MEAEKKEEQKKENGFKRFLKAVFVHNFVGKITAILVSVVLWALAVGLSTPFKDAKQQDGAVIERMADEL